jgi:hypothetical protein
MAKLIDKYFTKEEQINLSKEHYIPEIYYNDLISFIEKDIQTLIDLGNSDINEIRQATISEASDYFKKFDNEIQKGHSIEWSSFYAESIEDPFTETYKHIKKINPELARKELEIHCKAMKRDDLYTKIFIYLMDNGFAFDNPDKMAETYSKIYKEQILAGKSEIFANKYADLIVVDKYKNFASFVEASEYEKAFNATKLKEYAYDYSEAISDFIVRHFSSYEIAIIDNLYKTEKQKIEDRLSLKYKLSNKQKNN